MFQISSSAGAAISATVNIALKLTDSSNQTAKLIQEEMVNPVILDLGGNSIDTRINVTFSVPSFSLIGNSQANHTAILRDRDGIIDFIPE